MEPQETRFMPSASPQNGYGTTTTTTNHGGNGNKATTTAKAATARAVGPDLLRGLLMVLMAMDHTVVSINSWPHGQGSLSEDDSMPISRWNRPIGYAVRTMTHLCAPGFFFLLGMGLVYFGRSRSRLGWSDLRMVRHFAIRAAVLTLLTVLMGVAMDFGHVWFLNVVLFALGFDYLVVGLLWLLVSKTEPALASLLASKSHTSVASVEQQHDVEQSDNAINNEDAAARRPLLSSQPSQQGSRVKRNDLLFSPAGQTSYHVHNLILLALVGITIYWNIWLSPTGGRCISINNDSGSSGGGPTYSPPVLGTSFIDFWFHAYLTKHIISPFPPMGWLSFTIAGLLYGRLVLHPSATAHRVRRGTLLASLVLATLFVLTRVLHFGNLSEDCLHTPDQEKMAPGGNQYLASPQSFFYLTKYPPDVAFFSYTLAVDLLFLTILDLVPRKFLPITNTTRTQSSSAAAAADSSQDNRHRTSNTLLAAINQTLSKLSTAILTILLTFGNSALFFYMIHQFLVFGAGLVLVSIWGEEIPGRTDSFTGRPLSGVQSIWAFWGLWLFVMVVMFPLCRWYARFKATKGVDSVWRFF